MRFYFPAAVLLLSAACSQSANEANLNVSLATSEDSLSYAIGLDIGKSLKNSGLDSLNVLAIGRGIQDSRLDDETKVLLTEEQVQATIQGAQAKMMAKQEAKMLAEGAEALAKEAEFLAENGKVDGVTTTESGLQYQVIKAGSGPNAKPENTVTVHYVGTLLDGTKFDSSIDNGQPVDFPLSNVISGWIEGISLMNKNAKFKFWIPSKLGYGPRGNGPIGPNATLIFEVELLDIK